MEQDHRSQLPGGHARRATLGFFLLLAIVLGILTLLPVSVLSMVSDLLGSPDGETLVLSAGDARSPAPAPGEERISLDIGVIALDEGTRLVTLRVSGHRVCGGPCQSVQQLVFYSLREPGTPHVGLPPSYTLPISASTDLLNRTFELPVNGQPIQYPFDTYQLRLAFVPMRQGADGRFVPVPPDQVRTQLDLTFQEQLPRMESVHPRTLGPGDFASSRLPDVLRAEEFTFQRPLYIRVLAVLLISLITIAAMYTSARRTLPEFLMNIGGVVITIWGVRSILVPSSTYLTAVDLALSVVILFLLGAVIVRVLFALHRRSGLPRWHELVAVYRGLHGEAAPAGPSVGTEPRVERVTEPVTQQVDGQHG